MTATANISKFNGVYILKIEEKLASFEKRKKKDGENKIFGKVLSHDCTLTNIRVIILDIFHNYLTCE